MTFGERPLDEMEAELSDVRSKIAGLRHRESELVVSLHERLRAITSGPRPVNIINTNPRGHRNKGLSEYLLTLSVPTTPREVSEALGMSFQYVRCRMFDMVSVGVLKRVAPGKYVSAGAGR